MATTTDSGHVQTARLKGRQTSASSFGARAFVLLNRPPGQAALEHAACSGPSFLLIPRWPARDPRGLIESKLARLLRQWLAAIAAAVS